MAEHEYLQVTEDIRARADDTNSISDLTQLLSVLENILDYVDDLAERTRQACSTFIFADLTCEELDEFAGLRGT